MPLTTICLYCSIVFASDTMLQDNNKQCVSSLAVLDDNGVGGEFVLQTINKPKWSASQLLNLKVLRDDVICAERAIV
jgi:hypothetical protein